MRYIYFALLVILSPGLVGCGGYLTSSEVEREVAARAPELIGPAESYRVTLADAADGRIGAIGLTATGVKADSLVVDPLHLRLEGVQYQRQPFHVTALGRATFEARISEAAINSALRQQGRTAAGLLKNVRVEFTRGTIRVAASVALLNVEVPIDTTGRLQAEDGVRLNYVVEQLRVGGIGVPPAITGQLMSLVNPLVNLSGLRFTPRVTRVVPEVGALVVGGSATLRNLP